MFNCVKECYTAKEETKKVNNKLEKFMVPCTKIIDDQCPLYDPNIKWGKGRVCIFPNAALKIKEIEKPNYRKYRNR